MHRPALFDLLIRNWLNIVVFGLLSVATVSSMISWRVHSIAIVSVHHADMTPVVKNHDAVLAKRTPFNNLKTDDIVSFYSPWRASEILTARVHSIDSKNHLVTVSSDAGQNSLQIDSSLLVGTVKYRMAHAGFIFDFLRSRYGLALCVYLPALVIIGQELQRLAKTYDREIYRRFGVARL